MDSSKANSSNRDEGSDFLFISDLLSFASRAQTLIAELLLLSSRIPSQFRDRRYDSVLFDLRYFESPDDFEARIEGNLELEALEDELRESCCDFMQRFFLLSSGIVLYYHDLFNHVKYLQEGMYVESDLGRVVENENGRQLITESLTLFGCLLLLLEHFMGGPLREKLLVAHVRHDRRCLDISDFDSICSLCRALPSTLGQTRQIQSLPSFSTMVSVQRPDDLFARFPFPKQVVEAMICHLRDDDLYNRVRHFPDPEHRTVALASQGGYLYILLFFLPDLLHNGLVMREIVDRFFRHFWVVPVFMYFTVDLSISWDAYRAAKTSLSSCLSPSFIRDLSQLHCVKVKDVLHELDSVLSDGTITRDYVLSNSQSLLSLIRSCNVSLRWLLLHRSSTDKKLRDIVTSVGASHHVEEETLLLLLLKTSQLEFKLKQCYTELLERKETLWQESRCHASNCMQELSEIVSESQALSWKIKDESLKDWFRKLSLEVTSLDYTKTENVGRKLHHMISTLQEIQKFHQIDENLQIRQHLFGTQKYLQNMLRALNLHHDTLSTFTVITDAVYAWELAGCLTDRLFLMIEQDSSIVLNLHCFFLKFQSMLALPLLRISQDHSHSQDLQFVSNFCTSEYVARIHATLKIIPVMLSRILNDHVVCSRQSCNLPNRVERDNLLDFMQLEQQLELAKAINKISIFSQGIQIMSRAFIGIIDLGIKNWLEEEIRKDLSERLKNKLKSFFLSPCARLQELETNVQAMTTYVFSQFHLMECLQDVIHIQGNHIWEEEFHSMLKHCAQEEHDGYVQRRYQDSTVTYVKLNDFSKAKTFLGLLLNQMLQLTNPSRSMYIEPMSGWFDAEGHELLGLHLFDLLESCVGPIGLASLDSLLAFLITENLGQALRGLNNMLDAKCLEELQTLDNDLGPPTSLPLLGWSSYKRMAKIVDTVWEQWVECLAFIGQLQLLRCLILLKLKSACKLKGGILSFTVESMIASVFSQRERIQKNVLGEKARNENGGSMEHFLQELSNQGVACGFCFPFERVYISKDPPAFLGRCASIMTVMQLSRYVLDIHLGTLTSRFKKDVLDFSPVVIGLGTFLRQFDPTYMKQYVQYMGQYIRIAAEAAFGIPYEPQNNSADPSPEVLKSAFWLMYFCKHMGVSKDLLDSCLPPSLFSVLQT